MTDSLTCREAFDRLEDFVDRELDPAEAALVTAHLEVCARCAAEFRFEGQVLDGLRARLARIRTPDGLADRVTTALRKAAAP